MNHNMKGKTISLRALEPTDLDILYKWENDANLWMVTDTMAPFSRQMLWQYLENYTGDIYQSRELRLMACDTVTGEPVGTVDFFNFSPLNNRAELGLFIAPEWRGRGIGREALELLCDYACNHIGLRQIYVYIPVDNEPCLSLFDDYGFTRVGVLKHWVKRGNVYTDVVLMQLIF